MLDEKFYDIEPIPTIIKKKTAPQSIEDILQEFLESIAWNSKFENQDHLIEEIKKFCLNNKRQIPTALTQPNISRALKVYSRRSFPKIGKHFIFKKADKQYRFVQIDVSLIPFFELKGIYLKKSVHIMSQNTIVFSIIQNSHDSFIQKIKEKFPDDILWSHYSLGDHLILMFNYDTEERQYICNLFKEFFFLKKEYETKILKNRK